MTFNIYVPEINCVADWAAIVNDASSDDASPDDASTVAVQPIGGATAAAAQDESESTGGLSVGAIAGIGVAVVTLGVIFTSLGMRKRGNRQALDRELDLNMATKGSMYSLQQGASAMSMQPPNLDYDTGSQYGFPGGY